MGRVGGGRLGVEGKLGQRGWWQGAWVHGSESVETCIHMQNGHAAPLNLYCVAGKEKESQHRPYVRNQQDLLVICGTGES